MFLFNRLPRSSNPELFMNILIATDAWEPQVNGVVKTLKNTIKKLEEMGHAVKVICPSDYWCF